MHPPTLGIESSRSWVRDSAELSTPTRPCPGFCVAVGGTLARV